MKLKPILEETIAKFRTIPQEQLIQHATAVFQSKRYKDFETRIAWDCLRAVVSSAEICGWYRTFDCQDTHLDTLAKTALKEIFDAKAFLNAKK
jgi:hypothetical protein